MSIPTPWRVIGNSTGVGVSKTKIFEAKYEANLNFGIGGEFKPTAFNLVNNIKKLRLNCILVNR